MKRTALLRFLEAIAEAGGIANDAGDTVIIARIPAATEVADSETERPEKQCTGSGEPLPASGVPPQIGPPPSRR